LRPLGCPNMLKNRTLMPIVSEHGLRLSGHLAKEELFVTCVQTRLLAVRTRTNLSSE